MNFSGKSRLLNLLYLGKKYNDWKCVYFMSLSIDYIIAQMVYVDSILIFLYSDGRVTSSTTKLIQTLLVLDPKKRLTASQVLSVLSETMRKW